jgi:biopolymer transport protein ExbB/TolQ
MKPKWRNTLIIIGLFIAVVLLVDFNRRMEELNRLTTKLEAVHAQGTTIMQTQAALVTQVAYATSDR